MKLNTNTLHPSAFISSTFLDLKEERIAIANVLKAANVNVNALDVIPAATESSRNQILKGIQTCDFVVVIIGSRYGPRMPSLTRRGNRFSVTHWEYITAYQRQLSILAFIKETPPDRTMTERDMRDLEKFKNTLTERHAPRYFSDPQQLASLVHASLISVYRAGALENQRQSALAQQRIVEQEALVVSLQQEVERLSSKLSFATHGTQGINSLTALRSILHQPQETQTGGILDFYRRQFVESAKGQK